MQGNRRFLGVLCAHDLKCAKSTHSQSTDTDREVPIVDLCALVSGKYSERRSDQAPPNASLLAPRGFLQLQGRNIYMRVGDWLGKWLCSKADRDHHEQCGEKVFHTPKLSKTE